MEGRQYKNGFAKDDFLQFMYNQFPTVYEGHPHSRQLLENIIDYCTEDNFTHTKNELFYTLEKLIPEIKPSELLDFFDEKMITQEVITYCQQDNFKFEYMLLGRCQQDCEYFLGFGNRSVKHLYGGDIKNHISTMRELFEKVPVKPEWLSLEDINRYEELMSDTKIITKVSSLEELHEAIEQLGWTINNCSFSDNSIGWEISQYSPAGEDFSFAIEHNGDIDIAIREIKQYAENFDIDEHIEMWIEAKHNVKGVPSASELVKDATSIQEMLDNLTNHCTNLEVEKNEKEELEELEEDEPDI